jgi:ADP-ribosylation factor protein 6
VSTVPTIGFNVETVQFKKVKFNVWVLSLYFSLILFQDVGGADKIRPLWRHYYSETQALIFVVDSTDKTRMDEAKSEFHRIIEDKEMKDAVILIFANKNDLPFGMTTEEITEMLELSKLKDRQWSIQSCCGISGEGLVDGFTWLGNAIQPPK